MADKYYALSIVLYRVDDVYRVELSHIDPDSQAEVAPVRGAAAFDLTALLGMHATPEQYGAELARQLFEDDKIKDHFVRVETAAQASGKFLRILVCIDPSAQELQGLRWELLRHPQTDAALSTSQRILLSRFMVSSDWRPVELRARGDLTALIAVSAPPPGKMKLAQVDYEGEVARARSALAGIDARTLGGLGAPLTRDRLLDELRKGVDILYLVSHGKFGSTTGTALLTLQDDAGQAEVVKGEALAVEIGELQHRPRLVVLASCQSAGDGEPIEPAQRTTAQAWLAGRLAEAGVPGVLAMQGFITMQTVKIMMPAFFTELLRDGQIDRALAVARSKVRDRDDAWMPALYSRLKDGRLWSTPGGESAETWQRLLATSPTWGARELTPGELAEYRRVLIERHERLELNGFGSRMKIKPLLRQVHVRRMATDQQLDHHDIAVSREQLDPGSPKPLDQMFVEAKRYGSRAIVLLGDPGSGKTTHLKWMLLQLLDGEVPSLPRGTLPVFLPLREVKPKESLASFVQRMVVRDTVRLPDDFAARLLKSDHLLFLFDGLDEVANETKRVKVARWVDDQCAYLGPGHHVVATCRHASYVPRNKLGDAFLQLQLALLGQDEVEDLVERWYGLHCIEHGKVVEAKGGASWATTLLEQLSRNRSQHVAEMKGNPLLLTAICMVRAKDRVGELPVDAAALFRQCTDVLLDTWPDRMKEKTPPLTAAQTRAVLEPTAYHMQKELLEDATADQLDGPVGKGLARLKVVGTPPHELLEAMRDTSGLLVGARAGEYRFVHRGFREYLAAMELRGWPDERELERVANGFGDSWWKEVIPAMLTPGDDALFERFMQLLVRQEQFVEWASSELMDEVLAQHRGVAARPWADLVKVIRRRGSQPGGWDGAQALLRRGPAAWSEALLRLEAGTTVDAETKVVAGVELVLVPGERFLMGSPEKDELGFPDERPQHEVVLESFWLARTPVTNAQYRRFLEDPKRGAQVKEPSLWGDRRYNQDEQPVVGVSWNDAQAYCKWAGLVLPTEAQWEYACRAGTTTQYWSGDSEEDLARVGWYKGNSGSRLHAVREKDANAFGLYDMHGNVYEWCADTWVDSYMGAKHQPVDGLRVQPVGDGSRVIRGGGFDDDARYARSAYRCRDGPGVRWDVVGFRPAQGHPFRS